MTLSCPFDCQYLIEARTYEKFEKLDPATLPNLDIRVTDEFLNKNDNLIMMLSQQLLVGALGNENTIDTDIHDAIEGMVKTYRTRQSGLVYDSLSENKIAAHIQQALMEALEQIDTRLKEKTGSYGLRDADVLGSFVFLQRIALSWNNKRPRGRAFFSFLLAKHGQMLSEVANEELQKRQQQSSIIVP